MSTGRPTMEEVLIPYLERGVMLGWDPDRTLLAAWAQTSPEEIVSTILQGDDLPEVLVDVLAARFIEASFAPSLLDALVIRIRSDEVVTARFCDWDGTAEWLLARRALETAQQVLERRGRTSDDHYSARIVEALHSDLDLLPLLRTAVVGAPPTHDETVARTLCAAAAHPTQPSAVRMAALDAVRWGARKKRRTYEQQLSQLIEVLFETVVARRGDRQFLRQFVAELGDIAPEKLDELQAKGVVWTSVLPDPGEISRHGVVDLAATRTAAVHVSTASVFEALQSDDPALVVVALWLLPFVQGRAAGDEIRLARATARHVGSRDRVTVDGENEVALDEVVRAALDALLREAVAAAKPEAVALAVELVDLQLERIEDVRPFMPLWTPACDPVTERLLAVVSDDTASLAARWAAFYNLPHGAERSTARRRLLFDASTRPGLRALLGLDARNDPEINLSRHADQTTSPWTVRIDAALPIVEPIQDVPLEWLFATVCAAEDNHTLARALMGVAARFKPAHHAALAPTRDRFRAAATVELLNALRGACADDEQGAARTTATRGDASGVAVWAAQLLAFVGETADADAVGYGAAHGLWFADPYGLDWTPVQTTVGGLSGDAVSKTYRFSGLQPYVETGFEESDWDRIWARAYVWLARRHEAAERFERAGFCWEHARRLDPADLDARRALR